MLLSRATGCLEKVGPAKRCQSFPITLLLFIYYVVVDLQGELEMLNKHRVLKWPVSAEFGNLELSSGKKKIPERCLKSSFCSWS